MIDLKKYNSFKFNFELIHISVFFLAIIALPFNGLKSFELLGGLGEEGAFYLFTIGIVFWIIEKTFFSKTLYYPKNRMFYIYICFIFWIGISGILNIESIIVNRFKGIEGLNRLIIHGLSLVYYGIVVIYIYNIFLKNKKLLTVFHKACIYSFCLVGFYSVFEIGRFLGNYNMIEIINFFDEIFRPNSGLYPRIRSVSGEASAFATYLSLVLPWILSGVCVLKKKKIAIFLSFYMFILILFTFSRTAYFISAVQVVFYLIYCYDNLVKKVWKEYLGTVLLMLVFICLLIRNFDIQNSEMDFLSVYFSFLNNDAKYEISNIGRIGSQMTALLIFLKNPIVGVGFAQYGFYMAEFVPSEAFISQEILNWASSSIGTPWPPVHGLYARLLCELGFLGLLLWVSIWISFFLRMSHIYQSVYNEKNQIQIKLLSISAIGILLVGFNTDIFRFFGYWIVLGLALGATKLVERKK